MDDLRHGRQRIPERQRRRTAMAELSTTTAAGLQGIAQGSALTIHLAPYGSTGTAGKFYTCNTTGEALRVTGTLS